MQFYVRKIALSNFRNYSDVRIETDERSVVIIGANGAGKTNILEAISLLTPGKGLRRAAISELDNLSNNNVWAIASEINGRDGISNVSTGRIEDKDAISDKRIVKIDGKIPKTQTELGKIFSVLWLTPQMDNLFLEGNTERRKFIDRLVFSFNPQHATKVNAYDNAMRQRNHILQERQYDTVWLDALEQKMAEFAVLIASARNQTIELLNNEMESEFFPKAEISLIGEVENNLKHNSTEDSEIYFRKILAENRMRDKEAGRTLIGIHRTKIEVVHLEKNRQAELCSTGEQKAILISIILAQARAGKNHHGHIPV
ncbi:MAG: DNA replication/repair protein RecF, partial [Pseudomonadota bacterium]